MTKEIPLTKGKVALVDDEDFVRLNQWKWLTNCNGYAARNVTLNGKCKTIFMHRVITATPDGFYTDHINGNILDNRKINLRVCTHRQNIRNAKSRKNSSSKYKGVSWCSARKKWAVYLKNENENFLIGRYKNEEDAALAYNEAAKKYFGEFARLNSLERKAG